MSTVPDQFDAAEAGVQKGFSEPTAGEAKAIAEDECKAREELRDVMELLQKYKLGEYVEKLIDIGARRRGDLVMLENEDLDEAGLGIDQKQAFSEMLADLENDQRRSEHENASKAKSKESKATEASSCGEVSFGDDWPVDLNQQVAQAVKHSGVAVNVTVINKHGRNLQLSWNTDNGEAELDEIPEPDDFPLRVTEGKGQDEANDTQELRNVMDKYNLKDCINKMAKVGLNRLGDLVLLKDGDLGEIGLNHRQQRSLLEMRTAIKLKERTAQLQADLPDDFSLDDDVSSSGYLGASLSVQDVQLAVVKDRIRERDRELDAMLSEKPGRDDRTAVAIAYDLWEAGQGDDAVLHLLRSSIASEGLEWQKWMFKSKYLPSSLSCAVRDDHETLRLIVSLACEEKRRLESVLTKFTQYGFDTENVETKEELNEKIIALIASSRGNEVRPDAIFQKAIEDNTQWREYVHDQAVLTEALEDAGQELVRRSQPSGDRMPAMTQPELEHRRDFGYGLVLCVGCSRPCFNRGYPWCKARLCKSCSRKHTCHTSSQWASNEEEDAPGAEAAALSWVAMAARRRVVLNILVLNPAGSQVGEFTVQPQATVGELKNHLARLTNVDVWQQKLLHKHVILKDHLRWTDTRVTDRDALTLVLCKVPLQNDDIKEAVEHFCRGGIFKYDIERKYGRISRWDTSNVTDMQSLFKDQKAFNDDLSAWNVANVTSMKSMFYGASKFNGDLSAWNVASVTDMSYMFVGAHKFNGDLPERMERRQRRRHGQYVS